MLNYPPATYQPSGTAYFPFVPPAVPYILPPDPFSILIKKLGIRLFWQKSHACPCSWQGGNFSSVQTNASIPVIGSADPQCKTCFGRGIYWDTPFGPFIALISYGSSSKSADDPGVSISEKYGQVQREGPWLTVTDQALEVWQNMGEYDIFTEIDSTYRLNSVLRVGENTRLPYQINYSMIEPADSPPSTRVL